MTEVYFVNDTSTSSNWGCRATTLALRRLVNEAGGNISRTLYLSDMQKRQPLILHHFVPEEVRKYVINTLGKLTLNSRGRYYFKERNRLKAWKFYESLTSRWDEVPGTWHKFDEYAEKVVNGQTLQQVAEAIQATDLVVINGEGSIYDRQRKGRSMLFVAYLSKAYFDTDCIIVNHTVDLSDNIMREMAINVYALLDDIVFREPTSAKHFESLSKAHDIKYKTASDAAFIYDPIRDLKSWEKVASRKGYFSVWPDSADSFDPTKEYLLLGGSSVYNRPDRPLYDPIPAFQDLASKLKEKIGHQVVLTACSGDQEIMRSVAENLDLPVIGPRIPIQQLTDILGNASLLISGRWHSSVLALTGGTPIITLTANTHKTKGILELVDLDQPIFNALQLHTEVDEIIDLAEDLLNSPVAEKLETRSHELADQARENVRYLRTEALR